MTLRRALRKLHLQEGDILLVRDYDLMERLVKIRPCIAFPVPVIYAPEGHSLWKINKFLLKAAARKLAK